MTLKSIKNLITRYLGNTHFKEVSTGWVMTSCPFSRWLHTDGDDKNYSFGISVTNGFNCFTCGMKGHLLTLPKKLSAFTHLVPYDMEDYIKENIEFTEDTVAQPRQLITYNTNFLASLSDASAVLGLSKEDIAKWQIKQVHDNLLFPVFQTVEKLVAIKVRNIYTKSFYYILNNNLKESGVWYGQHLPYTNTLALVEGERDAILFSRFIPSWACMGNPTKAQINRIKEVRVKKIIVFFDNDPAGKKITETVISELQGIVSLFKVKDYLGCKDPAEIVEHNLVKQLKFERV